MQILSLITFRKGKTTHPPPSFYKNWLLCSDAISKINHPTHKIVRVPQDEFIIGLLWSALITYWPWWVLFTLIPLSFSAMTTMFCFGVFVFCSHLLICACILCVLSSSKKHNKLFLLQQSPLWGTAVLHQPTVSTHFFTSTQALLKSHRSDGLRASSEED